MEPAPYTTAVLLLRISSISILPFALALRRLHLRLSSCNERTSPFLERYNKVEMSDWPALPPDGIMEAYGGPVFNASGLHDERLSRVTNRLQIHCIRETDHQFQVRPLMPLPWHMPMVTSR